MKKTVVVTGGTSGIGAAVSRVLSADGWQVVAATISQTEIEAFNGPNDIDLVLMDVTSQASVDGLFGNLKRLDGLVNCAGILQRGAEYDLEGGLPARHRGQPHRHHALLRGGTSGACRQSRLDCQHSVHAQHLWRTSGTSIRGLQRRRGAADEITGR